MYGHGHTINHFLGRWHIFIDSHLINNNVRLYAQQPPRIQIFHQIEKLLLVYAHEHTRKRLKYVSGYMSLTLITRFKCLKIKIARRLALKSSGDS